MSTTFPTTIDALTNPTATTKENVISHADQHANANDAIEAIETKVGVDGSAVTTTLDYKLKSTVGGHNHDGVTSKLVYIPQQDHAGLDNLAYGDSGHTGFEATIGHTTEDVANKSTDTALGTSDVLYPTQNASKTYADTKISKTTNITSLNETGIADGEVAVFNLTSKDIRTSNVTIATTLGADDTTLPTSKAVKDVTDALTTNSYTWEGAWVTATAYVINDLVENDGSAYICTVGHTSGAVTEPGVGADWENDWDLMVQKGSATANTTMARAYLAGAQINLTDATDTKVLLDAENWDVGSNFDTTNKRYVVPVTGYYHVSCSVGFSTCVDAKIDQVMLYVNASAVSYSSESTASTSAHRLSLSDDVYAVAGQYIELYARCNTGASTTDLISTSTSTFMAIHLIST